MEEVMAAIPHGVWDQGYKLLSYSPIFDAAISIPLFKLWIDIEGAPLELFHESHMARAVSSFGCYLGSMEPRTHGDSRIWSIFLATDDLAMIPRHLEFRIGGIVHTAAIHPRKWIHGQVYQRADLPPSPVIYQPTPQFNNPQLASKSPSVPDPLWFKGDDIMHMRLKAMREIFRNVDPAELPPDLAECLAGNTAAIKAHNEVGKRWERQILTNGKTVLCSDTSLTPNAATTTSQAATADLAQDGHCPVASHLPRCDASRPSSQASLPSADANHVTEATVHRTEPRIPRGKRPLDDLALQVCSPHFSVSLGEDVHPWEPRDLFPEIGTTPNHLFGQSETSESTEANQVPPPKNCSPSRRPRHANVNRIAKKKNGDGTVDIDMQAFVDVPLQHAEGTEILALIGAGHIPIPPHLVLPPQQINHLVDAGQPSKAPQKKKKHSGPNPQSRVTRHTQPDIPMGHLGQQALEDVRLIGGVDTGPSDRTPALPENAGDDPDDDPYIDRVDYSDDDPLF